ncbi:hypothetical protein ACFL7M_18040 [Thermodesulfobacteriota bacterium]
MYTLLFNQIAVYRSIPYRIQDNILFLKAESDYSAEEFLDLLKKALNDPGIPKRFTILIDARFSEAKHRIEEIEPIFAELRKWGKRITHVAVIVQSNLHFGLTRQAAFYTGHAGQETMPFREIESAMGWIKEKL